MADISKDAGLPPEAVWIASKGVRLVCRAQTRSQGQELDGRVMGDGVEIRDSRFASVVGKSAAVEKVAGGFLFTEGPLWHAADRYLLFSDMPADHLRRWSASGGVTTFRKPCGQSNGLAWDSEGRLISCEQATSRLTRTEVNGDITVLASKYAGKELNSPNDVVVKSDGAIYFSDPTYERDDYYGTPRPLQLDFRGVYRVAPGVVRSPC